MCISHKEDVDGVSSAALITAAMGTKSVLLVDYANMIKVMEKIISEIEFGEKVSQIFICDLGLSKKNQSLFVELVRKLITLGTKVTYIDHHDIELKTLLELKQSGVKLIHSIKECTSIQIYKKYKKKLQPHAAFIAACGAITDYMDSKPFASKIVSKFDRQFLMLESTVLSYIISSSQHENEYLLDIIHVLTQMKFPHDIDGGFERAERYAQKIGIVSKSIEKSIVLGKNLASVQNCYDLSSSMIVNFVLGSSGKHAALVYRLKEDIGSYIISIRGSNDSKIHLGRIVNELSSNLGGSGGGHEKACGAVIPKSTISKFINELDNKLS